MFSVNNIRSVEGMLRMILKEVVLVSEWSRARAGPACFLEKACTNRRDVPCSCVLLHGQHHTDFI